MSFFITNIYIFFLALVLAVLEIQIEGKHGWAKKLPTWKPSNHAWYTKLFSHIFFKKQLTGYHLAINIFIFLIFNLPYVSGTPFILSNWLKSLSFYTLFIVLWDFLWFILNPHYSLKKFKKEHVPWHALWISGLPLDYWVCIFLSFIILIPLIILLHTMKPFIWWAENLVLFIAQTTCIYIFTRITVDKANQ